ncbi:FMN-binding negative transcriptional regulator [Robertkochia flava]|uniref:FMN-binding negative transcriptional regulator n=1 Tax=Robertkochia flava TaxID=3447986 RepID=UPI001CCCB3D5|nr:FMN-binding negative transcriptional regulator [Robertkochia marina]
MYQDNSYKDKDPDAIREFVANHPFAVLSGCDINYNPVATQVPVFLEKEQGKWLVRGHLIRDAEHHKAFQENPRVMLVFPGPHTYVSATAYAHQSQASTWNYMSVQIRGKIHFRDREALVNILKKTTLHFEKYREDSPTVYENLPGHYTSRLLDYIVAFEVEVEDMDHVFKLSQDKDRESFENVITHLREGDPNARAIAEEMEKRKKDLFG